MQAPVIFRYKIEKCNCTSITMSANKNKFTIENNILKGAKYESSISYESLGHFLLCHLEKNRDIIGQHVVETGQKYTYGQMKDLSVRCALWLLKENVQQNDIIGLCTHNHIDTFVPYFATYLCGSIFNAWYHDMNLKTMEYFMGFTKPKIIFADAKCVDDLAEAARKTNVQTKIVTFEKVPGYECIYDAMNAQNEKDVEHFKPPMIKSLRQTAIIVFSSGTSGVPKGVELCHETILKSLQIIEKEIFRSQKSLNLFYSSMYWISAGLFRLMIPIMGSTILIHQDFDPHETCKVIEKFKVNWVYLPTSMFHRLYKSNIISKYDLSSLRQLLTGGTKVNVEALAQVGKELPNTLVVQSFGMTEMGGIVTTPSPENPSAVGTLAQNVEMKVLDQVTLQRLASNKIGELCFKSPYMMKSYYLNYEATREAVDEEGWMHTGDLGYYDENGHVFVVDRIKEIMKVKGHQIAPVEIEDHLNKHPDITECAVIGVPHLLDNNHPMAFVIKKLGAKVTEEDVLKMAENLGDLRRLRAGVHFLNVMPHTPSGKVDRKSIRAMAKLLLVDKNYTE